MSPPLPLAADSPAPDVARWRALSEQALAGAKLETLTTHLPGGVALAPLYTADGAPAGRIVGRAGAWDIRQLVEAPDPDQANADALGELTGGATSIELRVGGRGLVLRNADDLARALDGVMIDLAPVALDAGGDPQAARWLAALAARRGAKQAALAFNVDPLAPVMAGENAAHDDAFSFAREIAADFPNATALRVDARVVHEAGGGEAQELGYALAAGVLMLRAGERAGMDAAQSVLFSFALGPHAIVEIAKLRAARLAWARVLLACGVSAPMRLHAATGARMMTRKDAWTNMLRVTAAAYAGGVGGADSVTTAPLTEAIGRPSGFACRIARNTLILLQEESHIARVTDPGAGGWAIESLTDELAQAGWRVFQEIERRGGLISALPWFENEVAKIRETRLSAARDKSAPIIGVTVFPPVNEKPFDLEPWPESAPPAHLAPMRLAAAFEDAA